jgi:type VI secretion system secreted protein VgrG
MDDKTRTIKITGTGDVIVEAKGNISMNAQKNFEVDAQQITLKSKSGVTVDGGGGKVEAKGTNVKIEGTAQVDVTGAMTNVKANGVLVVQGSLVKIN